MVSWSLPKYYNRRIARAIAEFELIEENDNIIVGFSGGKDSAFLVYALAILKEHLGVEFDLRVLTVDLGFKEDKDYTRLKQFCSKLEVEYDIKKTEIAESILTENQPCAKCAYFRKGVMTNYCQDHGFNKIAFGHHYDDAVETFLMSILYSGQVQTFQPNTYLSESNLHIIRPLVYVREKEITKAKQIIDYEPIGSACPYDGTTKRGEIKDLIASFSDKKQIFYNLVSAMRAGDEMELWPPEMKREELKDKVNDLW